MRLATSWLIWVLSVLPVAGQQIGPVVASGTMPAPPDLSCPRRAISCGASVNGSVERTDCEISHGWHADVFELEVADNQFVTIRMNSSEFDTYLVFREESALNQPRSVMDYQPSGNFHDDNGGGGTNSRVAVAIGRSGPWLITARGPKPGAYGQYTLAVKCEPIRCQDGPRTTCLTGMRFQVEGEYTDSYGRGFFGTIRSGEDSAILRKGGTGVDAEISVYDHCTENGHFLVVVESDVKEPILIKVTDTKTGATKVYANQPDETFGPVRDKEAFPCQ